MRSRRSALREPQIERQRCADKLQYQSPSGWRNQGRLAGARLDEGEHVAAPCAAYPLAKPSCVKQEKAGAGPLVGA